MLGKPLTGSRQAWCLKRGIVHAEASHVSTCSVFEEAWLQHCV